MRIRVRARLGAAALVTVLASVAAAGAGPAAEASPPKHTKRQLTVMTQNLYLGSSLNSAIEAEDAGAFVTAVATIYGTAIGTNFPLRAEAIADTIAKKKPDLIGLQEVTNWIAVRTDGGPGLPNYDFLTILQSELEERGLDYSVGAVSDNADIGPAPLAAVGGCSSPDPANPTAWVPKCFVTLQDRDVILVNDDTRGLRVRRSDSGTYAKQEVLAPPIGEPVSFARGWALVDGTLQGKKFRFVNTHLEVEGFAETQEAQAREFLAGPARARGAVIATGDFNSAADPSTTSEPTDTYRTLTKRWFDDAWWVNRRKAGNTCCQNGTLSNPVSTLRTRIDLVLTHGHVRTLKARVVGDRRIPGATTPPLWPSDHAGVVATLRLH